MAIEFITSDMVAINGHIVEIRDSRAPDYFDKDLFQERERAEAQSAQPGPIRDIELDASQSLLPLVSYIPQYAAYQQIPRFLGLARQAANDHGVSYRNFKVGAAAFAYSYQDGRVGYLYGANLTPFKGAPKRCAEFEVLTKAKNRGFDRIVALAVFGPSDFGDVNHIQTKTLHPCEPCRSMLDSDPIVPDDTLIITGNDRGDIELMFKRDLIDLHTDGSVTD
jgi:cytidine deaminase